MATSSGVWVPGELEWYAAVESGSDYQTLSNLARYWWAWYVVDRMHPPPDLVFDVGCGSGYGSRIIAEQHPNTVVCGLDKHEVALAVAREKFTLGSQIEFRRINLDVEWLGQFYNARPRLVVAFDVFERLAHRDAFLLYISELLRDNGWLLLSVEGFNYAESFSPHTPLKIHYSYADILKLLRRFFRTVLTLQDDQFPSRDFLDHINAEREVPLGKGLVACNGSF